MCCGWPIFDCNALYVHWHSVCFKFLLHWDVQVQLEIEAFSSLVSFVTTSVLCIYIHKLTQYRYHQVVAYDKYDNKRKTLSYFIGCTIYIITYSSLKPVQFPQWQWLHSAFSLQELNITQPRTPTSLWKNVCTLFWSIHEVCPFWQRVTLS